MIVFENSLGTCTIDINGYEFENFNDHYDANWLNISVTYSDINHVFIKPCLLTTEITNIINYVMLKKDWISNFIEPDIELRIKNKILMVTLSYDLVEIIPSKNPKYREYNINLDDEFEFRNLLNILYKIIEKFPVRKIKNH